MSAVETAALPLRVKLCFSTLGCGELHLEAVLDLAKRRRIPAIELRTLGGANNLPGYFETHYGSPDRLADLIAGSGVKVVSLDSSARLINMQADERAELVALAPWALAADAKGIRVFDGGERGDTAELDSIETTLAWWRALGFPLELRVETHDALAQPAALQEALDRYPAMTMLWDTHHTWKEGHEAPAATWRRLRGRTAHLHVKDSVATGEYVPPGAGQFPFAELTDVLSRDGFDGIVSLEWERHWFPELLPIESALDGFDAAFQPFNIRG